MNNFGVASKGISLDHLLRGLDDKSRRSAAVQTINKMARDYRVKAVDQIRQEVAFPASYLAPSQKRFYVKKQATGNDLEAIIEARGRATSLARFALDRTPGRRGVELRVDPGRTRLIQNAFLIPLRSGSTLTDSVQNLGLAIRVKRGTQLNNSQRAKKIGENLYLLYGPSVYQAFINNAGGGIAEDLTPALESDAVTEFLRLLDRRR